MVGLAWLPVLCEKASLMKKKACLAFPWIHPRRASVIPSKHRCLFHCLFVWKGSSRVLKTESNAGMNCTFLASQLS